ncbi:MAG TPA: 3-deoxy-7-phosphoheptulonate synthase class II [Kofleriaceae bacterium]|nr:3-deoxy-7-phosphoheptulonate synthase class II [Kofleriaceae bacterium]
MTDWTPSSWQAKTASQQPVYADPERVERIVGELSRLPPLVTSWEIESLKAQMACAARGEMFLLQGGDCAESFESCDSDAIAARLKVLLQMSLVLVHGTKKPVIRVGRIAGQYAKPRSADTETRDGVTLPTYRGDIINRSGFSEADRAPDPELLLRGYERAALTLNFIRSLADGGFADIHHLEHWDLSFAKRSEMAAEYERIVGSIRDSIEFLEAVVGASFDRARRVDFYTSHEGLSLLYEQAQTRRVPRRDGFYNLSTHLPWIGMRTADAHSAHVEYFRGVRNPIGIKVGPSMTAEKLAELLAILSPDNEPGRIMLIHRMGAGHIAEGLPPLVEAVQKSGRRVLWCADPMHGNTEKTTNGYKTRRFENILAELEQAFDIHQRLGTILGAVHFECTGEDVTECIGGARGLSETDLSRAYRTQVDPRLNNEQSLEMAMLIARHLRKSR